MTTSAFSAMRGGTEPFEDEPQPASSVAAKHDSQSVYMTAAQDERYELLAVSSSRGFIHIIEFLLWTSEAQTVCHRHRNVSGRTFARFCGSSMLHKAKNNKAGRTDKAKEQVT